MLTLVFVSLAALAWLLDFTVSPNGGLAQQVLPPLAAGLSLLALARLVEQAALRPVTARGPAAGRSDRLHTMFAMVAYLTAALGWLHYALGFNVTGLLATSAVVTLVIGLALQATLGNLFTGLSLELERQLHVGDYLQKGAIEGEVVALKWRSVFLRTTNNTRIVLPNNGLTTDAVEIVGRGEPARHSVAFSVCSKVPPMEVMAVAEGVLASGLPKVCLEPASSVIILGADPLGGMLRYALRYYTDDWPDRSTTASHVQARLWYALSRAGMAVAEPQAVLLRARPPATARPLPPPGAAWAARLPGLGERRLYGPDERILLDGAAAIVLRGSAREEHQADAGEEQARLAQLLESPADHHAPVMMASPLLARIAEQAALLLGPYAHELARDYATRTDDPRLLHLALATQIQDERDRSDFLTQAPAQASRRLSPGAFAGVARLLDLPPRDARRITSNRRCELLVLSGAEVRDAVADGRITAVDLMRQEPDLRTLGVEQVEAQLLRWLAARRN